MPSPFPGMDPFLEDPEYWHDIHVMLIAELSRFLNRALPEGLVAHIEKRVYIESPIPSAPDVSLLNLASAPNPPVPRTASGNVAILAPPLRRTPRYAPLSLAAVELPHIEIRTARGQKQVVTAIEILSPVNKSGQGRQQYQQKQQEILLSHTHLLEIDLLRGGEHTVAVPTPPGPELDWDYIVCLHRAGAPRVEFWDIDLYDSLPDISIPLTQEHSDLLFPLQSMFERIYDEGPFRREVDYTGEPTPRLKGPDAAWAAQLLQASGLRSA